MASITLTEDSRLRFLGLTGTIPNYNLPLLVHLFVFRFFRFRSLAR